MAQAPPGIDQDQLTIAARRVLLDALTALTDQRDALTIVGAQAVYLRTQNAGLRSAAYTSDGDISIDPLVLDDHPLLEQALQAAGFTLLNPRQPGLWARKEQVGGTAVDIEVDLLVPEKLAPRPGRRSAHMPPHDKLATRRVPGLEVAAADRSLMTVTSLQPADTRAVKVHVAGPVALLVAKAFKIRDRLAQAADKPARLTHKDAGDVIRIMRSIPADEVAASFRQMQADQRVGDTAREGLDLLHSLFGAAATPGVDMAVQALAGDMLEHRIRALSPAYLRALA